MGVMAVLIDGGPDPRPVDLNYLGDGETCDTLRGLQRAVGGYVACIDLGPMGDVWVNKEPDEDAAPNIVASTLVDIVWQMTGRGGLQQPIMGPVVWCNHNEQGETIGLWADQAEMLVMIVDMLRQQMREAFMQSMLDDPVGCVEKIQQVREVLQAGDDPTKDFGETWKKVREAGLLDEDGGLK